MYTVKCTQCGVVENNISPLYCDKCNTPLTEIKLGGEWHGVEELEDANPY